MTGNVRTYMYGDPSPPPDVPSSALRRRRTGRNKQVSIKATRETIERLVAISHANSWPFGETLEYALDALERRLARIERP
jgi:hypothetical protein